MTREGRPGRKNRYSELDPIDEIDQEDEKLFVMDPLDRRTRKQVQEGVLPPSLVRDSVIEALKAVSEDETGVAYFTALARQKPEEFNKLVIKALPKESYFLKGVKVGGLAFLLAMAEDDSLPVEYRQAASIELLRDQSRVHTEALRILTSMFAHLKIQHRYTQITEESMLDLIDRMAGWTEEELLREIGPGLNRIDA